MAMAIAAKPQNNYRLITTMRITERKKEINNSYEEINCHVTFAAEMLMSTYQTALFHCERKKNLILVRPFRRLERWELSVLPCFKLRDECKP